MAPNQMNFLIFALVLYFVTPLIQGLGNEEIVSHKPIPTSSDHKVYQKVLSSFMPASTQLWELSSPHLVVKKVLKVWESGAPIIDNVSKPHQDPQGTDGKKLETPVGNEVNDEFPTIQQPESPKGIPFQLNPKLLNVGPYLEKKNNLEDEENVINDF